MSIRLTTYQCGVIATLAGTYNAEVLIEETNMDGVVAVTHTSDAEHQYLIGSDAGVLRLGGDEGMCSVDDQDFHVVGDH